jgi:hypothetical protein
VNGLTRRLDVLEQIAEELRLHPYRESAGECGVSFETLMQQYEVNRARTVELRAQGLTDDQITEVTARRWRVAATTGAARIHGEVHSIGASAISHAEGTVRPSLVFQNMVALGLLGFGVEEMAPALGLTRLPLEAAALALALAPGNDDDPISVGAGPVLVTTESECT